VMINHNRAILADHLERLDRIPNYIDRDRGLQWDFSWLSSDFVKPPPYEVTMGEALAYAGVVCPGFDPEWLNANLTSERVDELVVEIAEFFGMSYADVVNTFYQEDTEIADFVTPGEVALRLRDLPDSPVF
jgi:hypothetical protein